MSHKTVVDYQRDYEQLLYRRRQLEEQRHQLPNPQPELGERDNSQKMEDKNLLRYKHKLARKDYIPSIKCRDMILDWCKLQFSTSRIVASRCYKQAVEYLESGCRKKDIILGSSVRDKLKLSEEDCAKFWGIEMEFKVKHILRECFHLTIDECETFHHSKDRTVVAKPDGFVKSGITLAYMPENLETSFEIKGSDDWLAYENKAPMSGNVPNKIKKEYFLQCMLEMACTGCKATFYTVWSPYCMAAWIIYWDQQFWNTVLKPLYFEGKINFDLDTTDTDAAQLKMKFDTAIETVMQLDCQKVFVAHKTSQNADWRFESCALAADQPEFDLTKVSSFPLTTIPAQRAVYWQKTPNLERFVAIQRSIFVNK